VPLPGVDGYGLRALGQLRLGGNDLAEPGGRRGSLRRQSELAEAVAAPHQQAAVRGDRGGDAVPGCDRYDVTLVDDGRLVLVLGRVDAELPPVVASPGQDRPRTGPGDHVVVADGDRGDPGAA
jgi:hypothetical protein